MPKPSPPRILDLEVFALTAMGRMELQDSGTTLSARELEVLVLVDGKSQVDDTLSRLRSLDREAGMAILADLLRKGLIGTAGRHADDDLRMIEYFKPAAELEPSAAALAQAAKRAEATARMLQQQGYSVRIAKKGRPVRDSGGQLRAMVVEDEPHLAKVLRHVLASEGFDVRLAKDKEEILAEIRREPVPDLLLLDVVLPDIDGFEVLQNVRDHPTLRDMTVVMLTAQATRDAVLKGLAIGADGYITKPFEIDVLMKALHAVLGLAPAGSR